MAIPDWGQVVNDGGVNTKRNTAQAPASGRGTVARINHARRAASSRPDVLRAQDARRQLQSRQERFAHLKRMHD